MECNFANFLVYETYFILWTILLNTVFFEMTVGACPVPCHCTNSFVCYWDSLYVSCSNRGLKEVPTDMPDHTCEL